MSDHPTSVWEGWREAGQGYRGLHTCHTVSHMVPGPITFTCSSKNLDIPAVRVAPQTVNSFSTVPIYCIPRLCCVTQVKHRTGALWNERSVLYRGWSGMNLMDSELQMCMLGRNDKCWTVKFKIGYSQTVSNILMDTERIVYNYTK